MQQPIFRLIIATVALFVSLSVHAEGRLFKVPTREGVSTTLFWLPVANARATVFLFPGGGGGFGRVEEGRATGNNFLVRSVPYFVAHGFNVAIFGRPNDSDDLDYADRIGENHLRDVRAVLDFVRQQSAAPLWLVGTSRGTISAAATAINLPDAGLSGLVLTSSVVNFKKPGAIPKQDLAAIGIPVLVLHHSKDECILCRPYEVPAILNGLSNAPVKKLIMVDGGANPRGDVCAAEHWHGFIGMEPEVVGMIADWIRAPVN